MTIGITTVTTTIRTNCWNQIQIRNRIEVIIYIEGTNQVEDDKRKREGTEVMHSFYKRKKYILLCRTRSGTGTVHTPYPWRGNSYSSSSQERRGRVSGITIRIVPTRQCIFHRTQHTILIATRHHHHKWLLHCHPCTNSSIPTCHRHITQSTASPNCTFMLGIIVL